MITFNPKLPDSFKGGEVFEFEVKSDQGITGVVVSQEHPSHFVDEFDGKNTKTTKIKFVVNFGSCWVTIDVKHMKLKESFRRPVHLKD